MIPPLGRLFVAVVLVNGVFDAIRVAVSYRVLALGGDATSVGLVAAMFAVVPMFLALRFGRLVDRRGSKGIFVVGITTAAVAVVGAAASPSLLLLAAANTVLGLGQIMTLIGAQGFVMELLERDRHVNGFAMFTLAVSVGQSVGTPAMGLLLRAGPGGAVETAMPLLVTAAVIAAALPFALSLPRRDLREAGTAAPDRPTPMTTLLARPGMAPAVFASLVVVSGIDLITAYLPVVGENAGLTPLVVTLLVATRSVLSMAARAATPWVLRRWGQRAVLLAAPAVATPALIVLGVSGHVLVLGAALAAIGLVWGLNQPVTMNWVTAAAPSGNRAAALSLRITGNRAAQVAMPLAAGVVAGAAGPGGVFLLSGAASAATALSTVVSLRRGHGP